MSNKSNFQESIFNSIGDAIIVANKSGEITQINPMAESLIGLSAIDAKGKSLEAVFNVLNTLTGEEYQDLTQHVINSGMVIWQSLNTKLITHSKKECLITGSANTLKDSKGTIEGVVISFREVIGLEQTEKLVSDARAQFKNLFNLSPIPTIFTSLPERIFIDINNATESLLGYKREDLIGHSTLEFDIFAVKEEREEIIRLLSDKGYVKGVEAQILTSRGETITCTLYIEILNQQGRTYSITQLVDVTEHQKIKKELVEKDILFHTLVEKSSEAITVVNEKGNAVYASPTAIAMLGYTAEELNKMRFNEIMHPDDIQMVEKVFVEIMQVPGKEVKLLGRQRQKSGEYIWCEGVATNWFHDPVINGIVVNFRDVTEQKLAEKIKNESEARFTTLFKLNPSPVGITRASNYSIVDVNEAWCKMTGYSSNEAIGCTSTELKLTHTNTLAQIRGELQKHNKFNPLEISIFTRSGKERRVVMSSELIKLNGEDFFINTFLDITELKQAELESNEVRQLFQFLFNFSPVAYSLGCLSDRRIVDVNSAWETLFGYSKEEIVGKLATNFNFWQNPDERDAAYKKLKDDGRLLNYRVNILTKSGNKRSTTMYAEILEQSGVKYMFSVFIDITESEKSEEAIRISLAKYKTLFENFPMGITVSDKKGNIIESNVTAETLLGISAEDHALRQLSGEEWQIVRTDGTLMPPEEYASVRALNEGHKIENVEMGIVRPDKTITWINVTAAPIPLEDYGVVVTYNDITERINAEKRLFDSLEREQFLGNLIRNASVAVAVGYPDGRMGMCNLAFQKLTGYSEEELKSIAWNTVLTPPECLEKEMVFLTELERTKQPVSYEKEYIHKSGKRIPIELIVHPIIDADGSTIYYYAFITDITEQRKAKLDLENSESKFRSIAENLTDVIAITDSKGVITYISPASLGVFGYNSDEMMGRFFGEFLAPDEKDRLEGIYNESVELDDTSHNLLIKALKKNGEIFYAELSSSKIIEDGNINGRLALIRDVTGIRLSEMRERNRSRILQMLTEEFKLKEILHEIQKSIEEESPDSICTILLIDKTGKHLQSFVPNQLPDFYNQAINGQEIGLGRGSCGTAAFTRESVFVENVFTHPYWEPFKEIAQKANFVSCWSRPIISFNGQVLGTFAIYGRKAKLPNEAEIARIDYAANLTRLAIEKKTSEEELLASEVKFRAVFNNAPVGISLIDSQRNLLDSNNMLANIVRMDEAGLAAGDYRARKYIREDGSEIPVSELASARAIAEKRSINNFVNGIVLESGETIWTQVSAAPLGPNDSRYVVITQDITERKLAIAALEENEYRLRKTLETTSDGFWVVDSNRRFMEVNEAYCKMSGYTREELINMSISDVEVLEAAEDTNERIRKIISEGSDRFDTVHRRKDGSLFDVEVSVNILDREQGLMLCFCRDITERKVAEKDLLESEKRFSTIFEDSPVAIAISRLNDGKIILVNDSAIDLFGFPLEEFIGKTTLDLGIWARPDDRQRFMELIRINQRVEEMETSIQLKNREKRRVLLWGELIEQAGEPCVMVEIIDITERKRAEQQLLEREADLINALELARMGSWHIDLSNYKLSVSENYKRLIGIDNDNVEITFDFFINRIHPEDAALMKLEQYNLTPDSSPVVFDFRFIMPDESIRWFQNSMIGEFSEGELIALKGTNIDITEKKNREEEIRKINETLEQRIAERTAELSDLYNNAPCGYHSLNSNGVFERVNDTELSWLGYSKEELVGRLQSIDLLTNESKEIFRKNFPEFKKRGKIEGLELDFIRKDGSIISVLLNATAIYDEHGNYIHSRTTIIDNTERKKAEIALREAQQAADKANIAKSEFLSRMSHELRTPLNSILGFAQLLEMGELNPNQQKGVTHIMRSGKHLLDLINEVLDISRIEAGRISLSPEPVQLHSVISETLDIVKPLANDKKISIELNNSQTCNLFIKADRQRVKQVLINLINNGIKYNNEGGYVRIECKQHYNESTSSHSIRILVNDNGYGISDENISNLFKPFERIGAEKTTIEGTGLGLAVAKKIIEAMGGALGVESKLNEGSTFWIEFPKCESQLEVVTKHEEFDTADSSSSKKNGTILYVEDNIPNIELIEQVLDTKFKSIKLVTTRFGKETVDLAIEHKPNLILLDLNLPDTHGSDVFEELKGNSQTMGIPVVVISADAMPNQLNRLLNAGVKQYLTKPLDISEFLKVVNKYVVI